MDKYIKEVDATKLTMYMTELYDGYRNIQSTANNFELFVEMVKLVVQKYGNKIKYSDIPLIIAQGCDRKYNSENDLLNLSPQNINKWFEGFCNIDLPLRYLKSQEYSNLIKLEENKNCKRLSEPEIIVSETEIMSVISDNLKSYKKDGRLLFSNKIFDNLVKYNKIFIPIDTQEEIKNRLIKMFLYHNNRYNDINELLSVHLKSEEFIMQFKDNCVKWYFSQKQIVLLNYPEINSYEEQRNICLLSFENYKNKIECNIPKFWVYDILNHNNKITIDDNTKNEISESLKDIKKYDYNIDVLNELQFPYFFENMRKTAWLEKQYNVWLNV